MQLCQEQEATNKAQCTCSPAAARRAMQHCHLWTDPRTEEKSPDLERRRKKTLQKGLALLNEDPAHRYGLLCWHFNDHRFSRASIGASVAATRARATKSPMAPRPFSSELCPTAGVKQQNTSHCLCLSTLAHNLAPGWPNQFALVEGERSVLFVRDIRPARRGVVSS